MIESLEEAIRADLESEWPEATFVDARTNTGYDQNGRTTSFAFRILAHDEKFEILVGPDAVRGDDPDAVVQALRDGGWLDRLREQRILLLEKRGGVLELGPRPDSLVL